MKRAQFVVMNLSVPEDRRVWLQAVALRDAGWEVEVACPALNNHSPGRASIDGISVAYFPAIDARSSLGLACEVVWNTFWITVHVYRRRRSIDLLQVANPFDVLPHLLWLLRKRGARTIYDQHDVVPELAKLRPAARRLLPAFIALERWSVSAAERVITTSSHQAERLGALYGVVATVVRTGGFETGTSRSGRRKLQSQPDGLILGYLGVIGEQDAVDDAVRALAAVVRTRPHIRMRIAGSGPAAAGLPALIHNLGLDGQVELLGWVDSAALPVFLDSIDAMVVPDRKSDFNDLCAMNKVTHALSAGLPIVMRPLRENELLVAGHAVVAAGPSLEDFADALAKLADMSRDQRGALGSEGRSHYLHEHTWHEHRRRYLEAVVDR